MRTKAMLALPQLFRNAPRRQRTALAAILPVAISLSAIASAQSASRPASAMSAGVAWAVHGIWLINGGGSPIVNGGAIPPGSLLVPQGDPNHSITILLPDGLRILYECFTQPDCARGFRVPALYRRPDPLALDLLSRVRSEITSQSSQEKMAATNTALPRDETLVVLDTSNHVRIAGLAGQLSSGRYTGELRAIGGESPHVSQVSFDKSGPTVSLPLPAPGLYNLKIADSLSMPRVDLFLASAHPDQFPSLQKSYPQVKKMMLEWNEDYQGWPIHDFLRDYMRSFFEPAQARAAPTPTAASRNAAHARRDSSSVAAEPSFSPAPGVFPGKTVVTLRCSTPGGVMRYTDDTSQPRADSHVYSAPVVIEGTELTIKAFCSAPNRKDSPVVTGVFRIHDKDDSD